MLTHPRQELYRMGILYNEDDANIAQGDDLNTVLCDVPVRQAHSISMFVIRHGKPKRSRRRAISRSLPPLCLSFSALSDDVDITQFLQISRSITPVPLPTPMPMIQHRESPKTKTTPSPLPVLPAPDIDIPLSLPPPSAFESMYGSFHSAISILSTPTAISLPSPESNLLPQHQVGDWTFITHPSTHPHYHENEKLEMSTPVSEPETWILIDDS